MNGSDVMSQFLNASKVEYLGCEISGRSPSTDEINKINSFKDKASVEFLDYLASFLDELYSPYIEVYYITSNNHPVWLSAFHNGYWSWNMLPTIYDEIKR
jgi:hypothetical protein